MLFQVRIRAIPSAKPQTDCSYTERLPIVHHPQLGVNIILYNPFNITEKRHCLFTSENYRGFSLRPERNLENNAG